MKLRLIICDEEYGGAAHLGTSIERKHVVLYADAPQSVIDALAEKKWHVRQIISTELITDEQSAKENP